jgi:hypothetical protein
MSIRDVPQWVLDPFYACHRRLADESGYLHMAMRGMQRLRHLPGLLATSEDAKSEELSAALRTATHDADWASKEAEDGFPLLHAHAVVGVWSAMEVLCEDFAIAWVAHRDDAWSRPEVERLKIPLAQYCQLSPDEVPRFVVLELQRSLGGDLRKGVGKLKAILSVFGLAPPVGENVQLSLHELCQVRNAIVHTGGLADKRLTEECPWLHVQPNDRIRISHELYAWYYRAARCYEERVLNQAVVALGLPGCQCPGVDEIPPRPGSRESAAGT